MNAVAKHESESWWWNDPDVHPCPLCGCPIQRVRKTRRRAGTLEQGMRRHFETVHPELRPVS